MDTNHSAAASKDSVRSTDMGSTPVERVARLTEKYRSKESTESRHHHEGKDGDTESLKDKSLGPIDIDDDQQQLDFDDEDSDAASSDNDNNGEHSNGGRKSSLSPTGGRRKALKQLKDSAVGMEHRKLPSEIELVRTQLKDTYQCVDDNILLHGYLHIQIIQAKGLRNLDLLGSTLTCRCMSDLSDPYVTVHAGVDRLIKTPTVADNLDPIWNLDYFVPVCHPVKYLEFRVKDEDAVSSDTIGKCRLDVSELIRFDTRSDNDHDVHDPSDTGAAARSASGPKMKRTGVKKTVHLDNKPHHGSFEYFVEFIPKDLLHEPPDETDPMTAKTAYSPVVPGVYFPLRTGNRMRYYIDADDRGEELGTPTVKYGPKGVESTWKPRRYFRDVYDSICTAKKMIYIVGWSVDYTQSLLRGMGQKDGVKKAPSGEPYSVEIGKLLNQKADEGVVVNLLVWDDMTSNMLVDGVVGTRDEQLRSYFRGSKVNLKLVPMGSGDSNIMKQFRLSVYYTHHQKCVIVDTPSKDLMAYVGGIDLTYGRYEDGSYPLFRSLQSEHKNDFHNACFPVSHAAGPRQPWHDIHTRVQGPATLDLLKNFEERWLGQGGALGDLVDLSKEGLLASPIKDEDLQGEDFEPWHTQLYRSIDAKTAKFNAPIFKAKAFSDMEGVEYDEEKQAKAGKRKKMMQHILKTDKEKEQHFEGGDALNVEVARALDSKRELAVDCSVHKALVHHIRNAQHSIYIESQYFLSSSFLWPEKKTPTCCNLVAAEIAYKICEKIEAGQRFTTYIVLPMWPEGLPDSASAQDILAYQAMTMSFMYKEIHNSIDRRRKHLNSRGDESLENIKPTDYLNFYCLANRETKEGGHDKRVASGGILNRTRRHLVYTHSKLTIVDDAVVVCGSANINQRSLDGSRDSELLMGSWQPNCTATKHDVAKGDIHGFRLHCWAHLMRTMDDKFRKPQSLDCVRLVNEIARKNWSLYVQEEPCDMESNLMPYPVKVKDDGSLEPLTENGKFPDTNSNILGAKKVSLPKYLTT